MCCMSKELRLELSEKGVKPLFNTITKHNRKVLCLFDTGATMHDREYAASILPNLNVSPENEFHAISEMQC